MRHLVKPVIVIQQLGALFSLVALVACTPKVNPRRLAYKPGGTDFTKTVPFDAGTDAEFQFDPTQIELTGGIARLKGADQLDDDSSALGFGGGTSNGTRWNSLTSRLDLAPSAATNRSELDPSWTPRYSNLIGYWRFNGTVGTIAHQASIPALVGSAGNAQNPNGSGFNRSSAKFYEAITFDGVDDYIDFGSNSSAYNLGTSSQTISAWVKFSGTGVQPIIAKSRATSEDGRWFLFWGGADCGPNSNDGSQGFFAGIAYGGSVTCSEVVRGYNDGAWHQVVAVWDRGANLRLYVDGDLKSNVSSIASSAGLNLSTANPLYVGQYPNAAATGPISGIYPTFSLDELAIWHTPLSSSEVRTLYDRQSARYSATFNSRIMDAGSAQAWTRFNWKSPLPFAKELPDSSSGTAPAESAASYPALVGSNGTSASSDSLSGLVALYHFNETAPGSAPGGKDFADTSGNGAHLTAANSSGRYAQLGVFREAFHFAGATSASVTHPNANVFAGGVATFSAWLKWDGTDLVMPIGFGAYDLFFYGGRLGFNTAAADHYATPISGYVNQWMHVVAEFHARDYTLNKLYINGQLKTLVQAAGAPSAANTALSNTYRIGTWGNGGYLFTGAMDELAIWNRPLHAKEVLQLYRRGANRAKFQVRVCTSADCSDDASGAHWKGPDGTSLTYFSELNNNSALAPEITFAQFTQPVGASRYFQYRAILESDDADQACNDGAGPTACSPELRSVEVGPGRFSTQKPTLSNKTAIPLRALSNFTETLGGSGCAAGSRYTFSLDGTLWFYFDGTSWTVSDGTYGQATAVAGASLPFSQLQSLSTTGFYVRAHLNSDGTRACELDQWVVTGKK